MARRESVRGKIYRQVSEQAWWRVYLQVVWRVYRQAGGRFRDQVEEQIWVQVRNEVRRG